MPGPAVGQLLHDLALAWRALSAYPSGHPTAGEALARAQATLSAVLRVAGELELGAGRDGLLAGEERFDDASAIRLAELLRRRGAAGVRFVAGADARELETFLRGLLVDPRRARAAGSLARELQAAGVAAIVVRDLDFSGFRLVEGEGGASLPEAGGLWERLVRRLLSGGQISAEGWAAWVAGGGGATDLFAALLGLAGGGAGAWGPRAGDQALGAAAADFVERPDAESAAGIGFLWETVDPPRRARLAAALADAVASAPGAGAGGEQLLGALPEGPAQAVRGALAAAAAARAAPGPLDAAMLERLRRLFATVDIDAAGEVDVASAVEAILELPRGPDEVPASAVAGKIGEELADLPLERAVAATLIELATSPEVAADRVPEVLDGLIASYRTLLAGGRLQPCAELAARVGRRAAGGDERAPHFRAALGRMADAESIAALVAGLAQLPAEAVEAPRELLAQLGPPAVRHLLLALAVEEERGARYRLLELLAALGPVVARDAAAMLADPRWYVVRNVLVLLRRVGDPGSLPHVRRATAHPDLRVRLEAIRNLFAFAAADSRELLRAAIHDPDPRLAEEAIELAGAHGIAEAVEPLLELLRPWDPFGRRRAVRLKAIRALGALGDGRALAGLARYGARFPWPPVAAEERRAVYRSLVAYPAEARRALVERGRRCRDREVRRLAGRLAAEEAPR
jgi:HEAT repeat protein